MSLERAGHGSPDLASVRAAEHLRRIGHADEARPRHLEHAELVRRTEAVLDRPEDAMGVVAVAFELQDAVDEVLEHARAGDRAVLRHMADEEGGDAVLLRDAQQAARSLPHLRHRARRRADLVRPERLHRVDHADGRPFALERLADDVELGLSEDLDLVAAAEPCCAELHLRHGLLTGDEKRTPLERDRAERVQEQRRLADARLTADEDDDAGTSPPPSTRSSSGTPVEMRSRLLADDLDQPLLRTSRRPASPRAWGRYCVPASELAAARAAASQRPDAVRTGGHVLDSSGFDAMGK